MRSQAEIIQRIQDAKKRDLLGFEWQEYFRAATKETAETFRGIVFKADANLSDWEQEFKTDKDIRDCCIKYMDFAWEKANGFRGISASRSMAHYRAWLWLLGEDDFEDIMDYEYYGKEHLRRICRFLGLDPDKWDDGVRLNMEPV